MKALVYTAEKEVRFQDEPTPEPGPGEVVVSIDAVGICGSDMHAYLGHDARRVPPLILGHEAAGRVVDGSTAGDLVVINPLITCGHCDECLGGRANLCEQRDIIGMYRPGALAERVAVERTVVEEEERIKTLRLVEEAKRHKEADVIAAYSSGTCSPVAVRRSIKANVFFSDESGEMMR